MTVADKIRQCRRERNLTQEQCARQADVPLRSLCMWESGHYQPKSNSLLKLAKFFGKTIEWFLED